MSDTDEAAAQSQFTASGPTFEVWTLGSELDEVELRQQGREARRNLLRLKPKPLSDEPMFVSNAC